MTVLIHVHNSAIQHTRVDCALYSSMLAQYDAKIGSDAEIGSDAKMLLNAQLMKSRRHDDCRCLRGRRDSSCRPAQLCGRPGCKRQSQLT